MPAGVFAGTVIAPVVLNVGIVAGNAPPLNVVAPGVTVALVVVAGTPLMVSFVNTLPGLALTAADVPPLKLSLLATIGVAVTVIVAFVLLQLDVLSISQMV